MELNNKEFYNRDLSWLRFNHRVLQEASDKQNPLYERLKFLAIFSSNLDEFFKVRVSNIRRIRTLDKRLRKRLITKPNKLLKKIKKEVHLQQEEFGRIFNKMLIPALAIEGVKLIGYEEFNQRQASFADSYFKEQLWDKVEIETSGDYESGQIFAKNELLYLAALIDSELVLAEIPKDNSRFAMLPAEEGHHVITYVDDIIKYYLHKKYKASFYSIKITRDAELYIGDEYSGNLLNKIETSLSNRDTGQVTRILIDNSTPVDLVIKIMSSLDVSETDIVEGGRYHNFKDFFAFPNPTGKKLSHKVLTPKKLKGLDKFNSIFKAIADRDRLLYFPYESFDGVINLMNSAAKDKKVTRIKITLYRVSKNSAIANGLLKAAKNGKDVTVFIETKARFDEANNIKWGKRLAQNGAKVIYSYPGIKVHSKILYIERIEKGNTKGYAYIGTGNFNEKTSRIYTDFGLMTAHPKLTEELLQLFEVLEGKLIIPKVKRLLISPFNSRSKFSKLIHKEISNATSGKKAYVILKLNSLEDREMIELLYKASSAGVRVRLLVRGICCLVSGVKGQSEHIYVTSIVDRFLEHARVYIFANDGQEKMYIGSADWMTRNLDHRIEVIAPVLDKKAFSKIRKGIEIQINDKVKSRIIDVDQVNRYVGKPSKGVSPQYLTYESM